MYDRIKRLTVFYEKDMFLFINRLFIVMNKTPPIVSDSQFKGLNPDLRIGFILTQLFTLLPFSCLIEAIRHAADDFDLSRRIYCHWSIIAPDLSPIRTSCGFDVIPNECFPEPSRFDYIVVIGGLLPECLELSEQPQAI